MLNKYINKVTFGDSLEIIKDISNESIDLIITDPPYGDNSGYGRCGKIIVNNEDETINYKILPELYRVLKNDKSLYLFSNWKFEYKVRDFAKNIGFKEKNLIVIRKNNIGMGQSFRNQHEFCIVLEKGNPIYNLKDFSNVQDMEHINHNKDTHPHQKGLFLILKIIEHSSNKGDLIFDPFLGSGTTAVACERLGRRWIGCEISQEYCKIANARIEAERIQGKLF